MLEADRVLFRRLAVFAGGWSLEAAEGICAGDGIEASEVLDLLTSLVDKSLVIAEGQVGEERYRFLETIRQYAQDRLVEAGEAGRVRDLHRDWYLKLAERAEPELIGPRQVVWLERLATEQDNCRAALEWCLERGPAESGLRLAGALYWFWLVRDHNTEARWWLKRVAAAPGAEVATLARAKARLALWLFAHSAGDDAAARGAAEEALALYRQLGDRRGVAWSLRGARISSHLPKRA